MAYILLAVAITAEIIATTFLKMSDGFTKAAPTICCVIAYVICYYSFSRAVMKINLGIAYATWCGVGIVATALLSFLLFHEKISLPGIIGIGMIFGGCILLNLYGN